jgi:hypothetical protein
MMLILGSLVVDLIGEYGPLVVLFYIYIASDKDVSREHEGCSMNYTLSQNIQGSE